MLRRFSTSVRRQADFSHVVIGGGAVGTAIASELQQAPGNCVALLEQHDMLGMETTSRNSEVIHAGLYYPPDSLKARLCVRGKELIYSRLDPRTVPYRRCGKWIVAQSEAEAAYLHKLRRNADALGVPTSFVSAAAVSEAHPLIRAEHGALESPTTGIVSAHALTQYFQAQFENSGGTVAFLTRVTDLHFQRHTPVYSISCVDAGTGEAFAVTADNVVNSAGLHAPQIANMLLPAERQLKSHFAKGNYFSYSPATPVGPITSRLIYPCPQPNASGLGTHLTFDLGGQVRFGPDLEWVDASVQDARQLSYAVSASNLHAAERAIATYFPAIRQADLQPSYSGIRPKTVSKEDSLQGFSDYYIAQEAGFDGFVNLVGIESPGLTSAFAIAEHVARML